jgi:hypothetical protein
LHQSLSKNLVHQNVIFPLFFLDERFSESPGFKWWKRVLKPVLSLVDNNKALLSNKICEIQYIPYHSKRYKSPRSVLSSQLYNFELVKQAIRNEKMVIVMRSEKLWLNSIPELTGNYIKLNSNQNIVISEKNLRKENFERLVRILNG